MLWALAAVVAMVIVWSDIKCDEMGRGGGIYCIPMIHWGSNTEGGGSNVTSLWTVE